MCPAISDRITVLVLFLLDYAWHVPGWSDEIANEFIRLAAADGRAFDQMQLQELVYIAHGWCLASTGEPLTGDRPEALSHGPEYRRLADALSFAGIGLVTREIRYKTSSATERVEPFASELDVTSLDWIVRIYQEYGGLEAAKLAALTRTADTPWAKIFADGTGEFRDIPHHLIRAQFVELAAKSG